MAVGVDRDIGRLVILAATTDNDLNNASIRVEITCGILGRKAFVVVGMAGQQEIVVMIVERLHQGSDLIL